MVSFSTTLGIILFEQEPEPTVQATLEFLQLHHPKIDLRLAY